LINVFSLIYFVIFMLIWEIFFLLHPSHAKLIIYIGEWLRGRRHKANRV